MIIVDRIPPGLPPLNQFDNKFVTTLCKTCKLPTKEGKPFCVDHLDNNPYIKEVMARISEKEREDEDARLLGLELEDCVLGRVKTKRMANPYADSAKEILSFIEENGPTSIAELNKHVFLHTSKTTPTIRAYVHSMVRARIVKCWVRMPRKIEMVGLFQDAPKMRKHKRKAKITAKAKIMEIAA